MGVAHIHVRKNGMCPPFCHPWVYVIHHLYPLSLQSMMYVVPIQPAIPLVCLNEGHTHNMGTDRRVQLADWGLHTCMPERRVCTLPFAIYMLEPPFTNHTPCLFHPCCVWRTFKSWTPPCLNDGLTHTHTKHGWQKGTGGWMRFAHVYDKEKGMNISLCHS